MAAERNCRIKNHRSIPFSRHPFISNSILICEIPDSPEIDTDSNMQMHIGICIFDLPQDVLCRQCGRDPPSRPPEAIPQKDEKGKHRPSSRQVLSQGLFRPCDKRLIVRSTSPEGGFQGGGLDEATDMRAEILSPEFRLGFRLRQTAGMPQFALYTQSVRQFVCQHGGNLLGTSRFSYDTHRAKPLPIGLPDASKSIRIAPPNPALTAPATSSSKGRPRPLRAVPR